MKINGQKVYVPSAETIVIPRQEGDIVFKAKAPSSYDAFDALHPRPVPPKRLYVGQTVPVDNVEDPDYKAAITEYSRTRINWMILEALKATDDLVFETVQADDPTTWGNYEQELIDAGFAIAEVNYIIQKCFDACGLNMRKIEEATASFLAGQGDQHKRLFYPDIAPSDTPTGELVNATV